MIARQSKAWVLFVSLLVVCGNAQGRPSDKELFEWARLRCAELGQPVPANVNGATVVNDSVIAASRHGVRFGPVGVVVDDNGALLHYNNREGLSTLGGKPVTHFFSDKEVDAALRPKLMRYFLGREYKLKPIWRTKDEFKPHDRLLFFTFRQSNANGYACKQGNNVSGMVDRVTGKIRDLLIDTAWTYEAPNFVISKDEAEKRVRKKFGLQVSPWRVRLIRYDIDPKLHWMYEKHICRLVYVVGPEDGKGFALVDTVTGSIWTWALTGYPRDRKLTEAEKFNYPPRAPVFSSGNPSDEPKPKEMEAEKVVGIVAGSLLASYLGIRFAVAKFKR